MFVICHGMIIAARKISQVDAACAIYSNFVYCVGPESTLCSSGATGRWRAAWQRRRGCSARCLRRWARGATLVCWWPAWWAGARPGCCRRWVWGWGRCNNDGVASTAAWPRRVRRVDREHRAQNPQRQKPRRHVVAEPVVLPGAGNADGDDLAQPHAGGRHHDGKITTGSPGPHRNAVQTRGAVPRFTKMRPQDAREGPQVHADQTENYLGGVRRHARWMKGIQIYATRL